MKWVILALWAFLSIFYIAKGNISIKEIYIGLSIILAAEYVAEEAKDK